MDLKSAFDELIAIQQRYVEEGQRFHGAAEFVRKLWLPEALRVVRHTNWDAYNATGLGGPPHLVASETTTRRLMLGWNTEAIWFKIAPPNRDSWDRAAFDLAPGVQIQYNGPWTEATRRFVLTGELRAFAKEYELQIHGML